jgi:ribosomal protein S9
MKLGIFRSLYSLYSKFRFSPISLKKGFLTYDARRKDRKIYSLKKARKAPQFSKR